jgi:hypothetical protein
MRKGRGEFDHVSKQRTVKAGTWNGGKALWLVCVCVASRFGCFNREEGWCRLLSALTVK